MVTDSDPPVDLAVTGGLVLTCDETRSIVDADVYITNERVVAIGGPPRQATATLDARGMLVIPGMNNLHDHLRDMTPGLSAGDGLKLDDILRFYWRLSEFAGPEEYRTMAAYSTARLLLSGVTSVVDHVYPFHREGLDRATIEGYEVTGIRWYMARGIMTRGYEPICESADDAFKSIANLLADGTPRDRIFAAPVSFRQAEPEVYESARSFADEHGISLYTHVAETEQEVAGIMDQHGCRPIELLERLGFLGDDTILVHCVLLSDKEIELLASTDTHVVHCPTNHMKLAKGYTRVPDLLRAGVNVGLGVDQMVDLIREMRQEVLLQSIRASDPSAVAPQTALDMATRNGAAALGQADELGQLAVGALADLVCVDVSGAHVQPILDPVWSLVHRCQGSDVVHVVVNGEVLVQDRRTTKVDGDALAEKAMAIIDRYMQRAGLQQQRLRGTAGASR